MEVKKRLKRLRQCSKCPWKKSTDPHAIPNGYSEERHRALRRTIAEPGALTFGRSCAHVMACHESKPGNESHCIGWLFNQLGPGNNIGLRLEMMRYDLSQVKLDGPQHEHFEDTLPKGRRPLKCSDCDIEDGGLVSYDPLPGGSPTPPDYTAVVKRRSAVGRRALCQACLAERLEPDAVGDLNHNHP